MKLFFVLLLAANIISCRKGAESKNVKYTGYKYTQKEFNDDTAFVIVYYINKSDAILKNPYVQLIIQDSSQVKKLLSYASIYEKVTFPNVGPKTSFYVRINLDDDLNFSEIGRIKFRLNWTNSKGKKSYRTSVTK